MAEVGSVDFDEVSELGKYYESSYMPLKASLNTDFYKTIFSINDSSFLFNRTVISKNSLTEVDIKTMKIAHGDNCKFKPMDVSGEVGATVKWGGDKGTEVSGYASGSASDDDGNTVEITVEVNNDGSGSATVAASHEEKQDSPK